MAVVLSGARAQFAFDKKEFESIKTMLKNISPAKRGGAIERGMVKIGIEGEKEEKALLKGRILKVRSGRLRGSISSLVIRKQENIICIIGSGVRQGVRVVYANIHDTGGKIRPVRAKMLAIPIGEAKTASGVARFAPRDIESRYDGSAIFRSKSGALIIWGINKLKSKTKLVPLFVLKAQVQIPERRYVSIGASRLEPKALSIMLEEIDKEVKRK